MRGAAILLRHSKTGKLKTFTSDRPGTGAQKISAPFLHLRAPAKNVPRGDN